MDANEKQEYESILLNRGAIRGFIQIQNVTFPFGRHIVPKFLYVDDFAYRPTMLVTSFVAGTPKLLDCASVGFDVVWNKPVNVIVIGSIHKRVHDFPDGSALYECLIEHPDNLPPEMAIEHENFNLKLYHHTSTENYPKIIESKHLRSSPWNYHGTKQMTDRHFVYFNDMCQFDESLDLQKIAMSDGGFRVAMQYDNPGVPPELLDVPVRNRDELSKKLLHSFHHGSLNLPQCFSMILKSMVVELQDIGSYAIQISFAYRSNHMEFAF